MSEILESIAVEIAYHRKFTRCADVIEILGKCRAEILALREALALHRIDSAYAQPLSVMLESAVLNPTGTWHDAHALLGQYRAACLAAAPVQHDTAWDALILFAAALGVSGRDRQALAFAFLRQAERIEQRASRPGRAPIVVSAQEQRIGGWA